MDEEPFNEAVAQLMRDWPIWNQQVNELVANLNAIAAGGAYAIPYTFTNGFNDNGLCFNMTTPGTQTSVYEVVVGLFDVSNKGVSALLDSMYAGATGTIKGMFRIVKVGDMSKFMVLSTTGVVGNSNARSLVVQHIASSGGSPFTVGDMVVLQFTPAGPAGNTGPAGSLLVPRLQIREEYANGVAGPMYNTGGWYTRLFNSTAVNTIPNASVASSSATLDPGTYDVDAWAVVFGADVRHRIALKNTSSGAFITFGSSEWIGPNQYASVGKSVLKDRIKVDVRSNFQLQHFVSGSCSSGAAVSASAVERYSEIIFEKVA
jgi:hypothetical protein